MEIDKKLHEEIKEYCKLNGLKIGEYINFLLRKAFNEDRFGTMPSILLPDNNKKNNVKKKEMPDDYGKIKNLEMKPVDVVKEPEIEERKEKIEEIKPKKTIRRLK